MSTGFSTGATLEQISQTTFDDLAWCCQVALVCQAEERMAIVFQVEYSEAELWEKILVHCAWDGGGLELRDLSSL